mgnify:CR=1 FL=1
MYLVVEPSKVILFDCISAKALPDAWLNPAICIWWPLVGAELNVTVIVFAVELVAYAVVGTPFTVTYNCEPVLSNAKLSLVPVVNALVEPSPLKLSNTI